MEKIEKTLTPISIQEFRDTGLLFQINALLHAFGMCIYYLVDGENGEQKLLPSRCRFRGWDEQSQIEEHQKIAKYLAETAIHFPEEVK